MGRWTREEMIQFDAACFALENEEFLPRKTMDGVKLELVSDCPYDDVPEGMIRMVSKVSQGWLVATRHAYLSPILPHEQQMVDGTWNR